MADVNTTGKIQIESKADTSGFDKTERALGDVAKASQVAADKVSDALGGAVKDVSGLYQDATGKWRNASGQFANAAEKAAAGVQGIGHAAGAAGNGMKALGIIAVGTLLDIATKAAAAGINIAKHLIEPIKASVSLAGDFEAGMNQFSAAAGKGIEDAGMKLEDFNKLFIDMGKKLPVSTMEVQQAATTLVKGGISPAILAAGGLESALKFAAGAEVDLNRAAEISVKQLSLFGDTNMTAAQQVDFLTRAQNLLVKAGNASAGNVDTLSDAVLMSGGAANAAGLKYEDFIQMITLISDKMPSAAEAGTSFKNMLMQLNPRTKNGIDAFQELGLMTFKTEDAINTLNKNGIKPLSNNAEDLTEQLVKLAESHGMTEKEVNKFMKAYQTSAFFDAKGEFVGGREAIIKLKDAFKDLTSADKMRLAQMAFGNDGMNAAMALIDGGADAWDKYTKAIQDANGVQEQSNATQKGLNFMIDQFKGSLEALGIIVGTAFLPGMTKIAEAATNVLNGVEPLFNFLSNDSAIGLQMFSNAMDAAFGPTAAIGITDFVKKAKDLLGGFFAWINGDMTGGAQLSAALVNIFGEDTATQIGHALSVIKMTVESVIAWITENWPKISATVSTVISEIVSFVQTNWPYVQQTISDVVTAVQGFINNTLLPAIASIMPYVQQVVTWIQTNWPMITTIFSDVVNAIVSVINDPLLPILGAIVAAIGAVIKFIVEHWPEIKAVIDFVVKAVQAKLQEYKTQIELAFNQAKNAIEWMKDFVAAIEKGWKDLKTAVETAWQKIETWFNTLPTVLKTIGDNMIKGLVDGIKAAGDSVYQAIMGIVMGAVQGVKDFLHIKSPSKVFEDIGSNTMQGFINGMEGHTSEIIARTKAIMYAAAITARNAVGDVMAGSTAGITGSTAHASPDAIGGGAGLGGIAQGLPHTLGLGGRSGAVDNETAPAGLSRDDWDAHDRGDRATPVVLQLDGHTLGQVMIGRMGSAIQQDARRYGRP